MLYRMIHYRVLQLWEWENIGELVNNLIETHKLKGLKAIWFQTFRLSQQVQEVGFL